MTQKVFLSHPVRDVRTRYVKQSACGAFAIVTVDFEPKPYGFELAIPNDVRFEFGSSFRQTGRMAVRTALERLTATTPSATTPSPAPSHPTTG